MQTWKIQTLVTVNAAGSIFGISKDEIAKRLDRGELLWAWDIGLGRRARALRLLGAELTDPARWQAVRWPDVVVLLLGPTGKQFRNSEVAQILMCCRMTVLRLHRSRDLEGPRRGHCQWVSRQSLKKFLKARLVGWAKPPKSPCTEPETAVRYPDTGRGEKTAPGALQRSCGPIATAL